MKKILGSALAVFSIVLTALPVNGGLRLGAAGAVKAAAGKLDKKTAPSAPVSAPAAAPDAQAPSVPADLAAVAVSSNQINLRWAASTDNVGVTNYKVYRNAAASPTATPTGAAYGDAGLSASTAYSYAVSACDAAGNCSVQSAAVSTTTLAAAPTVPAGVAAVAVSSSQINLTWTASTDVAGVTNYKVYRNAVQAAAPAGTAYSDVGLASSTVYSYAVSACYAALCSAQSAPVSTKTLALIDTQAPTVPTGLAAAAVGSSRIKLSWTAATDNVGVANYIVYRNAVQAAAPAGASYTDSGLAASTVYSYTVSACDAAGNCSAASSAAGATTDFSPKWTFATGNAVYSSPAIAADGTVYVGSDDGNLYAVNPNGSQKWMYAANFPVTSSPAIGADGTIYVGLGTALYAINPADGTPKWSYATAGAVLSSPASSTTAGGANGPIYVGSDDGNLWAFNPDGSLLWASAAGGAVLSSPAIGADGTIFVGSYDKNLYAINPADGSKKWVSATGGLIFSSPAIGADGTIYAGSDDGNLYAVNPANGVKKWTFVTAESVHGSPAISANGATVYVGSDGGNLYAVNSADGSRAWAFPAVDGVYSSPAVGADGTIYVGGDNGTLYAVNPNGTQKWAFATADPMESSPAIGSDGTVYAGGFDGNLYAVPGTTPLAVSAWPKFHRDLRNSGLH